LPVVVIGVLGIIAVATGCAAPGDTAEEPTPAA